MFRYDFERTLVNQSGAAVFWVVFLPSGREMRISGGNFV